MERDEIIKAMEPYYLSKKRQVKITYKPMALALTDVTGYNSWVAYVDIDRIECSPNLLQIILSNGYKVMAFCDGVCLSMDVYGYDWTNG